jgi:hypothetical protein
VEDERSSPLVTALFRGECQWNYIWLPFGVGFKSRLRSVSCGTWKGSTPFVAAPF